MNKKITITDNERTFLLMLNAAASQAQRSFPNSSPVLSCVSSILSCLMENDPVGANDAILRYISRSSS